MQNRLNGKNGGLNNYFFFNQLQKGSYTIEHSVYVTHKGDFLDGIATIQMEDLE